MGRACVTAHLAESHEGVSLSADALRHLAKRGDLMRGQHLADFLPERRKLRRAHMTGKVLGKQGPLIIAKPLAEPDQLVKHGSALNAEREYKECATGIVPSNDNGRFDTPLCPDMTLPGRKPSVALEWRGIAFPLKLLPNRLQRLEILMQGQQNPGPIDP